MKLKQQVGFLGCGNMGSAILVGLLQAKLVVPSSVWVYDLDHAKVSRLKRRYGIRLAKSPQELAEQSTVIVLAVKPQDLNAAALVLRASCRKSVLVISILAGMPIKRLRSALGKGVRVVRAMPNLGAVVGAGVTAITGRVKADLVIAKKIFSGSGEVLILPEKHFDLVTAVSGSGPAYFFYLMEHLIAVATQQGLSEKDAAVLVKQTAKGAALVVEPAEECPAVWRSRVTSKGGTTHAALEVFRQQGTAQTIKKAVKIAVQRAKKLGRT